MEEIGNLLIDAGGTKVPLGYVAEIVSTAGPDAVNRENVKRKIVVSANVTGGDLGGAVAEIEKRIREQVELPEGYYVEYGGQFESQQSASRVLSFASLVALLVIFLMDDRIKTDEDIQQMLGLSVLASIPCADGKKTGKYGYYRAYGAKERRPYQEKKRGAKAK